MFTAFRWLLRLVVVTVLLAVAGISLAYYFASRSLPDYNADYALAGLDGGVEIVRDTADVLRMTGGPTVDWRVGISQSPQEGEFYAGPQMTCAERNTGWRILA